MSASLRRAGWLLGLVAVIALLAAPVPTMPGAPPDGGMAMAASQLEMDGGAGTDHRSACCDAVGHAAGPHCAACLSAIEADIAPAFVPLGAPERHRVTSSPDVPPGGPGLPAKPPRLV